MKSEIIHLLKINKIPHAILFLGPEGCGNLITAINFSKNILCKEDDHSCLLKFKNFQHPDLHFIFPLPKKIMIKKNIFNKWSIFLKKQPYGCFSDWIKWIKSNDKQCFIYKEQIENLLKKITYKSYESDYKIIILWMPEKLTLYSSNKLLKILEFPTKKTIFLLVGENENNILPTILSRIFLLRFNKFSFKEIKKFLEKKLKIDTIQSKQIALKAEGNLNKALKLVNNLQENYLEINFISWIRNLFFIKQNTIFLEKIILFSNKINICKKETQIKFLFYLIEIFRKAFLQKYNNFIIKDRKDIKEIPLTYKKFNWKNFCLFIHKKNIEQINIEINKAIYEIENNAVVEIVFLDLSLKINELFKI
ncbi:DNA polymerase III subunit [Candidatus Karelsulcia muelleri]|uniref:DNA polymerase III subunit n=1 Tax=Candidatus Karelsulcia muelleri TaxID=336810 RepID=UPI000D7BEB20|nr:DNA polymerase III subunit delta' [Candidatus Karelsulcia muelleri]